ncbi:MAG: putative Amylo-alpha,6-glucosidase [Fibrobacteres bacterium]|nr:putative Amylo-alpha,6-glucosidase [Fibrobacterota bacterium]
MVKEDNDLLVVDSANPDFESGGRAIKGDTIHIFQSCFIWRNCCYLRFRFENFSLETIGFPISLEYFADFSDIFEVRGKQRPARGRILTPAVGDRQVDLGYQGLDGIGRTTAIRFDPRPDTISGEQSEYQLRLEPHGHQEFFVTIACETAGEPGVCIGYDEAFDSLGRAYRDMQDDFGHLESSHPQFNSWLSRSSVDLFMMITDTPQGMYPYAGIPWFSTVFGRDGIITALQMLWVYPRVAAGVLRFLAANQARDLMPERDAEPGKILHETRRGEMANLGEIPFGLYYGSVDSTPLFILLAGRYYTRTGDVELIKSIWHNLEAALEWIDNYGDRDGDGFVEYAPKGTASLSQQGWKDSDDSVSHSDGTLASHPIALCEVQGYVYAAKTEMAGLARLLGKLKLADRLLSDAEKLKDAFHAAFWQPDLGTYALALDGSKRPCRVRSSNAGQCLFTGIVSEAHAPSVVASLMGGRMFSGWGVRTLAEGEARYNPMSYHNGSVWPHDNALIALGMSLHGYRAEVNKILEALFTASQFVDLHRLPELYCGFIQRPGEGPTLYPVACNPQSWASASVYMLLQSCLGLSLDAALGQVRLENPVLPSFLEELRIRDLRLGAGSVDIIFRRHGQDITVEIPRRTGRIEVIETIGPGVTA